MTKQIKYSIFCNRKRFNILEWLSKADEKSYIAFCAFLASRNVIVPDENYFNRALNHFISIQPAIAKDLAQEIKEETIVAKELPQALEEIPAKTSVVESKTSKEVKVVKKTTRRKRRRKSTDVNNEN